MRALFRRFWSPAGFVLVGLCFLLPFIAVSCEGAPNTDTSGRHGTVTFTGVDLVTGGRPDLEYPLEVAEGLVETHIIKDAVMMPSSGTLLPPLEHPLSAQIALAAIAIGVVATVLPWPRVRALASATVAFGSLVALYAAFLDSRDLISSKLDPVMAKLMGTGEDYPHEIVPRYGLIIAAGLLALIGVANVDGWVRDRWKQAPVPEALVELSE